MRRVLRDFNLVDPDVSAPDDEADGYELAVSTRDFADATRKVVDEKLTFSAALLRAGELDEAQKILSEIEHDVRSEEAALMERVHEVSAKRAVGRARMTRLRMARMLATAMVGAGLLGMSAMGMAVAGMFDERKNGKRDGDRGRAVRMAQAGRNDGSKKVVIGGMKMRISKQDLATFRRLTSGNVDALTLERFLVSSLELPPAVVDNTIRTVLSLTDPVRTKVEEAVSVTVAATEAADSQLTEVVTKKKIKSKASTEIKQPAKENETEPPPEEEPAEDETPNAEAEEEDEGGRNKDGDNEGGLPEVRASS